MEYGGKATASAFAAATNGPEGVATNQRGDKTCSSHDVYEERSPQISNVAEGAQPNLILSKRMQDCQIRLGPITLLYKIQLAT
jgi:hypothetical protein